MTLNKEKCLFNQSKLTFFGFLFSSEGISPDPIKVAAIHDAPPPNSCKDVRSFLGLATYCSKFIPNFSDLTEPLRNLTKKNAKFCWTPRHEKAFQATKAALTSDTVIDYFDKHKTQSSLRTLHPQAYLQFYHNILKVNTIVKLLPILVVRSRPWNRSTLKLNVRL